MFGLLFLDLGIGFRVSGGNLRTVSQSAADFPKSANRQNHGGRLRLRVDPSTLVFESRTLNPEPTHRFRGSSFLWFIYLGSSKVIPKEELL